MPPANHIIASGAAVAVSFAVAAAIAIYESPELRRYADDVRRRVAITLTSMADGINPPEHREPLFNRPEDAHGFVESGRGGGIEIDADEASQLRQREEFLYWNALKIKKEEEKAAAELKAVDEKKALENNELSEKQHQDTETSYVLTSGVDTGTQNGLRHRFEKTTPRESRQEDGSDIYSATTVDEPQTSLYEVAEAPLVNLDPAPDCSESSATADYEYQTAGQSDREDAYASIEQWAQNSQPSSHLSHWSAPQSEHIPSAPASEFEHISDGELTPTSTGSVVDSDVMSESDGMLTPDWSEVGSVVSDIDDPNMVPAQ